MRTCPRGSPELYKVGCLATDFQPIRFILLASFLLAVPSVAKSPAALFKKVSPSIVVVDVKNKEGGFVALGSGVVTGAGEVITNWHVVKDGADLGVRREGRKYHASVRFADPPRDLCLLAVEGLAAPAVRMGRVRNLVVGQRVYAIGAPEGLELTLADGLISSLRPRDDSLVIQSSAPISPGSSGGGLFDSKGDLIGITTFQMKDGQNLNFALPVDWIAELPQRAPLLKEVAAKDEAEFPGRVNALLRKKDYRGALHLAQARAEDAPQDKWAWFYLGVSDNLLERFSEAREAFERALELDSKFELALRNEATAYLGQGRNAEAEHVLNDAVGLNEKDGMAWYLLGVIRVQKEDYYAAIAALSKANSISPKNSGILGGLGQAFFGIGDFEKAEGYERAAININPMSPEDWSQLGLIYYRLGRSSEMNAAFENEKRVKLGEAPKKLWP